MFFHTRVGSPSSPREIFLFAAFKALSISSAVTGAHGISFLIDVVDSRVGSGIFGKEAAKKHLVFLDIIASLFYSHLEWGYISEVVPRSQVYSCLP
jgi:hypothetical protein